MKLRPLSSVSVITILWILISSLIVNSDSFAVEVNRSQSTTGDKSPAVNAGRDSTINYNDDIEGRIVDKLAEVARKCNNPDAKIEDIKPELEAIVLYKARALPYIIRYASSYMDLNIDMSDPEFLLNYRTKLARTTLFNSLFYVIDKIYSTDPAGALSYISDLYMNPYKSDSHKKYALFLGYYLWHLPSQETNKMLSKWLKERPITELDPIRKVMLRTFLNTNYTEQYVISPSQNSETHSMDIEKKDRLNIRLLIFETMENGIAFNEHFNAGLYDESLVDKKDTKIGSIHTLSYEDIKRKLGERGIYLYGFDFYGLSNNNLIFDNVLLGKSFFEKSFTSNIGFYRSTLLECDFKNAQIYDGWIEGTSFVGNNLEGLLITSGGWGGFGHSVIAGSTFKETELSNTTFVSVDFIDTDFDDCLFTNSKSTIRGSLLLNVKFTACDPQKIVFDDVTVDEQTLKSISSLPGFSKSDYKIKEVDVEKSILVNPAAVDINKRDSKYLENSRQLHHINEGLNSLQRRKKYYDRAKTIIAQQKIFSLSSSSSESEETPEKKFAYMVSVIEMCGESYPAEKSDFEKAKIMLDKFVESRKNFSGVLTNPTVPSLIKDARLEVMEIKQSKRHLRNTCNIMKQGKFEIIDQ